MARDDPRQETTRSNGPAQVPDDLTIKDEVEPGKPPEAVIRIARPRDRSENSMGLPAGALPTLREALAALDGAGVSRRD